MTEQVIVAKSFDALVARMASIVQIVLRPGMDYFFKLSQTHFDVDFSSICSNGSALTYKCRKQQQQQHKKRNMKNFACSNLPMNRLIHLSYYLSYLSNLKSISAFCYFLNYYHYFSGSTWIKYNSPPHAGTINISTIIVILTLKYH